MRSWERKALVVAAIVLALASAARSGERAGANAAGELLRGFTGARPAAMGGAYTAAAYGPLALRYNPAGLAREDRQKIMAQFGVSEPSLERSDLAYSRLLGPGGFGVSLSYIDYGRMTRTTTTSPGGAGTFGAHDLLFRGAYGWQVTSRLDAGASLGVYRLSIDNATASGATADFALLWHDVFRGLDLGAALQNLGSKAQFDRERSPLPLSLVLGAAYRASDRLLLTGDVDATRNQDARGRFGAEYQVVEALSVRAGYDGSNEAGSGLTAGLGFTMKDLQFDYAFVPLGDIGNAHRFSAEYAFGPVMQHKPRAGRAPVLATQVAAPAATPRTPAPPTFDADERLEAGNRLLAEKRYDGAMLEYNRVLAQKPGNVAAWYNLATAAYLKGDYRLALVYFNACLLEDPANADAHFFAGQCYIALGDPARARAAWERTLALQPNHQAARQSLEQLPLR